MTHTIHHGGRVTCVADGIAYDGTVTGAHGDEILVQFDYGLEGYMFPEDLTFHPTSQQEAV